MRDNARPSPHGPCAGARGGRRSPRRQHSSATTPRPTGHFNPGRRRRQRAPWPRIAAPTVRWSPPPPTGRGAATTDSPGNFAQRPRPRRETFARAPFRPLLAECAQDGIRTLGNHDYHRRGGVRRAQSAHADATSADAARRARQCPLSPDVNPNHRPEQEREQRRRHPGPQSANSAVALASPNAPHATRPALLPRQPALMPLAATSSSTTPPRPPRLPQLGPAAPAPLGTCDSH